MMWLEAEKGLSVTCLTTQKRSSELQESPPPHCGRGGWLWARCGYLFGGLFCFFFKGTIVDHCLCGSTSTINLPNSPRTRRDEYSKTVQLLQEILSFNINFMLQLAASQIFKSIILHI